MRKNSFSSIACAAFVGVVLLSAVVVAQSVKVKGLITGRSGDKIVLQTADNPAMVVLLTDSTDVGQVQGMLKARHKEMSMAALIPGLAISVEGSNNENGELVATKIRFKGNDLKNAEAINAGMKETREQNAQQEAELAKQKAALQQHETQIAANAAATAANKAAIDSAVARFGQLDDYYIRDEVTVYFGNGQTDVEPKYNSQLLALANNAKPINGYMVEVKGFASVTGSPALNQKLSEDRAQNVTNFLLQQGKVPLTRMLAPGAMGESEQVGANAKSTEGQAENRRVVVRVLQNKAVAGI